MANLTILEASRLVGRSRDTIYRWQRDGVDITDRNELLNFSARQDYRARGAARQNCRRRQMVAWDRERATSEIQSRFVGVDPDEFVLLPAPYCQESADRVLRLMRQIEAGFSERLAQLEPTGHELNIESAKDDLKEVREAYRLLDKVFEGYLD